MTDAQRPIDSAAEFEDRLVDLLRQAHEAGVSVEGGWSCRNGSEVPDWDVMVTAVQKAEDFD